MDSYPKHYTGFVGFAASFGGKFFGGYARDKKGTNYANRGRIALLRDALSFQGIDFRCTSYINLDIPEGAIVYCDPPYEKTSGYAYKVDFATFWRWCDDLINTGRKVFVSSYSKPVLWDVVWEKKLKCTVSNQDAKRKNDFGGVIDRKLDRTEKLFTRLPR